MSRTMWDQTSTDHQRWPDDEWASTAVTSPLPLLFDVGDAFGVAAVSESVEVAVEALDAQIAVAPALAADCGRSREPAPAPARSTSAPFGDPGRSGAPGEVAVWLDDYARSILYNGLGHFEAAHSAAERACRSEDCIVLPGALVESIEACVRTGRHGAASRALARLDAHRAASPSEWLIGVTSCARALVRGDDSAEAHYLAAIERLHRCDAPVAEARAHLLYGEWLRRRGRRTAAKHHLSVALDTFVAVNLGGFADRAQRELLATGSSARRRSDDTRLDLTARELQIARLAAARCTNPEIGQQLFLSPRTVEWHLRNIFTKLGVESRRQLRPFLEAPSDSNPQRGPNEPTPL